VIIPDPNVHSAGFFALVCYVPEPLGPALDQLRKALPGIDFPEAHITLLPPRPLQGPLEEASAHALDVLRGFSAFDVELGSVHRFTETNTLYLDLAEGNDQIHQLHNDLATGQLHYLEEFEFHPHLTVGGPILPLTASEIQGRAEDVWRSLSVSRRFTINEVVALWAEAAEGALQWQRLWTFSFELGAARGATASP
jgi:2'-5' RNA ligase